MNHACLYSPAAQSATALWPVLIFRPNEGRGLSWPEWLVTNRGGLPARGWSPNPSTNRAWSIVTSLIETNALPLSQAATCRNVTSVNYKLPNLLFIGRHSTNVNRLLPSLAHINPFTLHFSHFVK